MKLMVFFVFTIVSHKLLAQAMPDPDKFTICAITINSDNEKKVFAEHIKKYPKKFNPIIELTEFGDTDWFDKACSSKIRCDQLIISGHFAGDFFKEGGMGKRLPLTLIEEKSCQKSCEGILSSPYEVFLFGCNTLATKDLDHRTPGEYLDVLVRDGFTHREAEMIVESRYGISGEDNRTRMKRAFGGLQKELYGFHSVGPYGRTIEGFLKKYFSKIDNAQRLSKLATKRMVHQIESANIDLKDALKSTNFTECRTGEEGADFSTRIICGLKDKKKSIDEKMALMIEALAQENYLKYVPAMIQFLKENQNKFNSEQKALIATLGKNKIIREQVLNLINHSKSLVLKSEWIQFAGLLTLINSDEETNLLNLEVKRILNKNVEMLDVSAVCALESGSYNKIKLVRKDIEGIKLTENHYKVLSCLHNNDFDLQKFILQDYDKGDDKQKEHIISSLKLSKSLAPEAQNKFLEVLGSKQKNARIYAVAALGNIDNLSEGNLNTLLKYLEDSESIIKKYTQEAFKKNKLKVNPILERIKKIDPALWSELTKK